MRQQRMMGFIGDVTDEHGWETKVFDEEAVDKWRAETEKHLGEEGEEQGEEGGGDVILSKEMFDFVSFPLLLHSDSSHLGSSPLIHPPSSSSSSSIRAP